MNNCITESGAIQKMAEFAQEFQTSKALIVGDINTFSLAGDEIQKMLEEEGVETVSYVFQEKHLEPDERAVGTLLFQYDPNVDLIIGIGSGVINDICKLVSHYTGTKYIITATAPMDGYASPLSAMVKNGLKVTIPSKCADVIIADTAIIKNAPLKMLKAGLGEMLSKYISICEWQIAHLIIGEEYYEKIANNVKNAVEICVGDADRLIQRDETAVKHLFEGLIITGESMVLAGMTRPASGGEHYMSHMWDMRGIEFGTPTILHGSQVGIAARICIEKYHKLEEIIPDREKALEYAKNFDISKWNIQLRNFLGKAAEAYIELEKKEGKYNCEKHRKRLEIIIEHWQEIVQIIKELPSCDEISDVFKRAELPTNLGDEALDNETVSMTIKASKEMRDKYVLARLLWDLGIIDEICV